MPSKKDQKKITKVPDYHDSDDGSDDSGTGGQGGQIEFHDFIGRAGSQRDDDLPFDEQRRLLAVHNDTHEFRVKKQKETRDQRKDVKNGKVPLKDYKQGMAASMGSQYKTHPALHDKAQFSGVDRQVNALPNENVADTNEANRNELENQYRKRYQPEVAPKFNPKPQPK